MVNCLLQQHSEKVDYWGLKKSILYTLFQAVKAITGGVTILKGQLIKGGGHLATTLGKVIAVKGDAVSNFGKKIVNSAALSQKKPHCKLSLIQIIYLFLIKIKRTDLSKKIDILLTFIIKIPISV